MIMKRMFLCCLGLLLLACGEAVIDKPENLIPKEKMVEIFHDLALLKAGGDNLEPILEYKGITIMDYLFDKHGIDSVQFVESDLYYASVPLEYQAIYEEVDAILERRKNAMEGVTKKKNDSVRKARKQNRDSTNLSKASKKEQEVN